MASQEGMSRRDLLKGAGVLIALASLANAPIIGSLGRDHPESVGAYSPVQTVRREPQLVVPLKFADIDEEPVTRQYLEAFYGPDSIMERYFREVSYFEAGGGITLEGTKVLDWMRLPHNRSYYQSETAEHRLKEYMVSNDGFNLILQEVSPDNLKEFKGLQFVLNSDDFAPVGGSGWTFNIEGDEATFGGILVGAPGHIHNRLVAHEMGHELADLKHHNNPWDPMSTEYNCTPDTDPDFCEAPHYNAFNKWILGIIGEDLIHRIGRGNQNVRLNSISDLPEEGYKKMAYVKNTAGPDLLVELRHSKGFDVYLPNNGIAESVILVYKVFTLAEEPLLLIDKNKDGNLADRGVMWLEGEKFVGERWDPDWKGIDFTIASLKNGRAELEFNISSRATVSGPTPTPFPTLDPRVTRSIYFPVALRNALTPF